MRPPDRGGRDRPGRRRHGLVAVLLAVALTLGGCSLLPGLGGDDPLVATGSTVVDDEVGPNGGTVVDEAVSVTFEPDPQRPVVPVRITAMNPVVDDRALPQDPEGAAVRSN